MKKIFIIAVFILFLSTLIHSEGKRGSDNFKLGVVLGYPSGITAGFGLTNSIELNLVAATHFSDVTIGLSPLFTIKDLKIGEETFPFSLGPAAYFNIDWNGNIDIDLLGNARIEYSFKDIPLNLFLEGGAGIKIKLDNNGTGNRIGPQGSGALGIRYIF